MRKAIVLLVGLPLVVLAGAAPRGSLDRVFDNLPIDQWTKERGGSHVRWDTRISRPMLGDHQRLTVRFKIRIDGAELLKRQGQGDLLFLVQLRDSADAISQNHQSKPLGQIDPGAAGNFVDCNFDAFVVPGDYEVLLGFFVSVTREHAAVRRKLHVPEISPEPLHDVWHDVPSVEFLASADLEEDWYQPQLTGRLNLRVRTQGHVRIQVVLNGSPTEKLTDARLRTFSRADMRALVPVLKLLSLIQFENATLDATILDLERRRVSFEQNNIRDLDWVKLHDVLNHLDPLRIDVGSLQNREQDAQFFLAGIRRRIQEAESSRDFHVLIVLSGPMSFKKGEDLHPIEPIHYSNCKFIYIRYYTLGPGAVLHWYPPSASRESIWVPAPPPLLSDSLVRLVQPLSPWLFDVTKPAEFRRALAKILNDLSRM